MKQPQPYPLYSDSLSVDGYWLYTMEESIDEAEAERRARIMRASPLLLKALEWMVDLGVRTWEQPPGSHTQKALYFAREAINLARNGTEEERELEEKFP